LQTYRVVPQTKKGSFGEQQMHDFTIYTHLFMNSSWMM